MDVSDRSETNLHAGRGLKFALLALTGMGVGAATVTDAANAQSGGGGEVTKSTVAAPKTAKVALPQRWQRVQIALTKEQQAQLAKLGVNTAQLDITTYNISQLGSRVIN